MYYLIFVRQQRYLILVRKMQQRKNGIMPVILSKEFVAFLLQFFFIVSYCTFALIQKSSLPIPSICPFSSLLIPSICTHPKNYEINWKAHIYNARLGFCAICHKIVHIMFELYKYFCKFFYSKNASNIKSDDTTIPIGSLINVP